MSELTYSSTAACATARRYLVSVTYRVSVKYWHLKSDAFCAFLHAHSNAKHSNRSFCALILSVTIDVGICNFKVISYIYLPIFKHEKQLFFVNATFFKIGTKYNPFKH